MPLVLRVCVCVSVHACARARACACMCFMRGSVRVHVRVRSCAYARVRTCARPCERTLSMVSRLPSWIGRSIQLGKAHPTWLQALYLCVRLVRYSQWTRGSDPVQSGGSDPVPVVTLSRFDQITLKIRILWYQVAFAQGAFSECNLSGSTLRVALVVQLERYYRSGCILRMHRRGVVHPGFSAYPSARFMPFSPCHWRCEARHFAPSCSFRSGPDGAGPGPARRGFFFLFLSFLAVF